VGPVQRIKEMGYSVRFEHFRPKALQGVKRKATYTLGFLRYMRGVSSWEPYPRGGLTLCKIFKDGQEEPVVEEKAECHIRDSFCYRLGRLISAGRALKELQELTQSALPVHDEEASVMAVSVLGAGGVIGGVQDD
jgi:hypothetical protein